MNLIYAIYCRAFQTTLKLLLPVLPYRDPKPIAHITTIPRILNRKLKHKPLIVTDQTIYKLGLTRELEKALKSAHIDYVLYGKVVANPTSDNVEEALKLYQNSHCDCIIAFGGGSPMDCAKGVGARIARPKKNLSDMEGILKVLRRTPLFIAIPTTAGTGSETTLACVIVDSKTRHKYAINDFPLIPDFAVLDESVTATLPPRIVATTGMDALTHAIESYIGRSGNRSTRRDALEACRLIFANIEDAYNPKRKNHQIARKKMLIAAHRAGRSFSKAYVGYVHALAHALGGKYDTPHGLANAVILPIVLREYGETVTLKLAKIAVYCELAERDAPEAEAAERLISRIEQLNNMFGIPAQLKIDKMDIPELAAYAEHEANPLYPVPVLWDKQKLGEMFYKIAGEKNV